MRALILLPLLLVGAGPSWLQRVNAADKQATEVVRLATAIEDRVASARAAGRPLGLAPLQSEVVALGKAVDRLDARIAAIEDADQE